MTTPTDVDAIREAMAKHRDRTRPAQGLAEVVAEAATQATRRRERVLVAVMVVLCVGWVVAILVLGGRPL